MQLQAWTPDVVEELLFRQYIKNENISSVLPPEPQLPDDNYQSRYEDATKLLFAYVRSGPATALALQNVNTAGALGGKSGLAATTPAKVLSARGPGPRAPGETPKYPAHARSPTPKGALTSNTIQKSAPSPRQPSAKRQRVEWPSDVPVNAALKNKAANLTSARVMAQSDVDPDLIFQQNAGDLPLETIFANYKNALKSVSAVRNASGNWTTDTFSASEEILYKEESGFRHVGPSQCRK